jgi:hypothetical protein
MMMAEAMAMSASKKTLCLRRSILRMRFIATAPPPGSPEAAALSSWGERRSCLNGCRTWRAPRARMTCELGLPLMIARSVSPRLITVLRRYETPELAPNPPMKGHTN